MSTNTYVALKTTTVSGSSTTSVVFDLTGITGYTDLILISSVQGTSATDGFNMQFNGDTASNYSFTRLYGNGSSAYSNRYSSQPSLQIGEDTPNSTYYSAIVTQIMNYSNPNTYKTVLTRWNPASTMVGSSVGLWRSTSAITSITLKMASANNIIAGSTFSIYGIKAV